MDLLDIIDDVPLPKNGKEFAAFLLIIFIILVIVGIIYLTVS